MTLVRYLTHPQVEIDTGRPVPDWGLSARGRARTEALAAAGWLAGTARVVTSTERKAVETGAILGRALGLEPEAREALCENDRSATGYLPPPEFEAVADRFFAEPECSVRGWERAIDVQARTMAALEDLLLGLPPGPLLLVGHGAAGTLLLCALAGWPISRGHDQPPGGGHHFAFDARRRRVLHAWQPMEIPS